MKRIGLFDNLKGVMILTVIFTHLLECLNSFYHIKKGFFLILGFYMMPVFLFITGFLTRKSSKKLHVKIIKTLILYLLFQTILILYYHFILKTNSKLKFTYLYPQFTLWYLCCMIWIYLITYLYKKINYKIALPLSVLLSLLIGFTQVFKSILGIPRTLFFLPFYTLGYYQEELKIMHISKKYYKIIRILIIAFIIFFLLNGNLFHKEMLYGKNSYTYTYSSNTIGIFMRIIFILIAFLFILFFFGLKWEKTGIMAKLGKESLVLYLTHGLILKTIIKLKLLPQNKYLGIVSTFIIILGINYLIVMIKNELKEKIYNEKATNKFIISKNNKIRL